MRIVGCRLVLFALVGIIACFIGRDMARAQVNEQGELSIELVDPKVLRICADPRNLPFSNDKGEGSRTRSASCSRRSCRRSSTTCIFRRRQASCG